MNRRDDLQQYAELIESMIPKQHTFKPTAEDPFHIQVERGLYWPVVEPQPSQPFSVVDAAGHARPVYRPLLVYSWLLMAERSGDVREPSNSLHPWIESLDDGIFSALVLAVAGALCQNEAWNKMADERFGYLINHQHQTGAFLPYDAKANPEHRWYEELILLHATASYAVRAYSPRATLAVKKSALFHLQETQPDHASAQPWGLLAFAQFAPPLADQVLHALSMQYPAGVTGVPLLLLTDALYGLRRLINGDQQLTTDN